MQIVGPLLYLHLFYISICCDGPSVSLNFCDLGREEIFCIYLSDPIYFIINACFWFLYLFPAVSQAQQPSNTHFHEAGVPENPLQP